MMRRIEVITQGQPATGLAEANHLDFRSRPLVLILKDSFPKAVLDGMPRRLKIGTGINIDPEVGRHRFSTGFSKEKDFVYRSRRGGSGRSRRLREQQQCQLCSGREGNQCFHTVSPILFSKLKLN